MPLFSFLLCLCLLLISPQLFSSLIMCDLLLVARVRVRTRARSSSSWLAPWREPIHRSRMLVGFDDGVLPPEGTDDKESPSSKKADRTLPAASMAPTRARVSFVRFLLLLPWLPPAAWIDSRPTCLAGSPSWPTVPLCISSKNTKASTARKKERAFKHAPMMLPMVSAVYR